MHVLRLIPFDHFGNEKIAGRFPSLVQISRAEFMQFIDEGPDEAVAGFTRQNGRHQLSPDEFIFVDSIGNRSIEKLITGQ
ncbi:MAG: hypothetical protein ACK56I_22125 [bacterium]